MQFKRMTNEDIKYSTDDTIIGPRFIKGSDTNTGTVSTSLTEGINVFKDKEGKKIPIKLEENQFFEVDPEGRVANSRCENWFIITNPSPSDKLWNVSIDVPKFKLQSRIGEIDANQGWKQEIPSQSTNNNIPVTIKEIISRIAYPKNEDVPSDLYLDKAGTNYLHVSIFVANNSNCILKEFDLLKKLPATVENLLKVEAGMGKCDGDKKGIKWHVKAIQPYEKLVLNFQVKISPVPAVFGDISAVFFFSDVENAAIVEKFKASAKIAHFIEVAEQDDHPDIWNCSLKVINRSLFPMNVLDAKLIQTLENVEKTIAELKEKTSLKPFEEKALITAVIEAKARPALKDQIELMPEFLFENAKMCSISIAAKRLEILNVSAKKIFDVDEIESYKESQFSCKIETQNFSSVYINHLFFDEVFPDGFEPGEVSEIQLQVGDKSMKIQEVTEQGLSDAKENSLDPVNSEITTTEDMIKSILQNPTDLDSFDVASISQQIEKTSKDLRKTSEDQASQEVIVKGIEGKLASLKKEIEQRSELASIISSTKTEISDLSNEFNEQSDVLKTIQNQKAAIEKEIKALEQKTEDAPENVSPDERPTENRLSLLITQEAQIQEKITSIKTRIEEKDQKLKEMIKGANLSNESRSRKDEIDAMEKKVTDLGALLERESALFKKTTIQVDSLKDAYVRYTNLKNNADLFSKLESLRARKQKIELQLASNPDYLKLRDCLLADFKFGAKDSTRKAFDATFVKDELKNTHLFITLMNLASIASAVNSGEKVTISYPLRATKPRHDVEYKFGSTMHYITEASQGMQKYAIGKESLPKLRLIHERHKMMVGKLIDKQSNDSKYFVTLLVKNSGGKPLKDVKIIETFPGEIEILNAGNRYEEIILENGNKQVVWFIDQVNSFQESEIGYVVDLHGKEFDLNDSQLCFI